MGTAVEFFAILELGMAKTGYSNTYVKLSGLKFCSRRAALHEREGLYATGDRSFRAGAYGLRKWYAGDRRCAYGRI